MQAPGTGEVVRNFGVGRWEAPRPVAEFSAGVTVYSPRKREKTFPINYTHTHLRHHAVGLAESGILLG